MWCRKGRRGQRLVEAPGNHAQEYGCGLLDWRDAWFDWQSAPKGSAPPVCAQLRRAVARSQARGRIALVLLDNLGTHTPKGSLLVRALLEELRGQPVQVYTPTYDPEANRIEWLWRALRRAVTHTHTHSRETLPPLLEDADAWRRNQPASGPWEGSWSYGRSAACAHGGTDGNGSALARRLGPSVTDTGLGRARSPAPTQSARSPSLAGG